MREADMKCKVALVEDDLAFLANKTGPTRLGCALLLKCFQYEGRFPPAKHDIPRSVVDYVAHQLKLDAALYAQYDWEGRMVKGHWTQNGGHLTPIYPNRIATSYLSGFC